MRSNELSDDQLLRLERLVTLKNQGALSEAEFEEQKACVINSDRSDPSTENSIFSRPNSWSLTMKHKWIAAGAVVLIMLAAALLLLLRPAPVNTLPKLPEARLAPPLSPVEKSASPSEAEMPPQIDTAAELRISGWVEAYQHGLGCMMERRDVRANGLAYVAIPSAGAQPVYGLGFKSPLHRFDGGGSQNAERNPELVVAVLIDGVRLPATLQTHFTNHWDVEIPLTSTNRNLIARARSIGLQLGTEVIAQETIRPNSTSISTVERCLKP